MKTCSSLLVAVALVALGGPALAEDTIKMTIVTPDQLTWKDAPALPKGAQVTVVMGDPTKPGEIYVSRVKYPPNYRGPARTHPQGISVTILSGSLGIGEGDKLDVEKGKMLKAGSYFFEPGNHALYVWTTDEGAVAQVQGIGPASVSYVNPADDPRKR